MKTTLALLTLLISSVALAIPEETFRTQWREEVLPFFEGLPSGVLRNRQGLELTYFAHRSAANQKVLVILPGRTEPARKYAEVLFDLRNEGYDLVLLDHQGQGESGRLLRDTEKGHVARFDDYVRDVEQLMSEVVLPLKKDIYILAHSMGGTIATLYLKRHPGIVKKAVLSAPMLELDTTPYTEPVARIYAGLLVILGKGSTYAPGQVPYVNLPFEGNTVTHSEVRYQASSELIAQRPELAVGGATVRWVNQALKVTRRIDRAQISTPVLLFQAGQELVVKNGRQNTFCRSSFCRMLKFPEARHEILMEKDSIRGAALQEILKFFRD